MGRCLKYYSKRNKDGASTRTWRSVAQVIYRAMVVWNARSRLTVRSMARGPVFCGLCAVQVGSLHITEDKEEDQRPMKAERVLARANLKEPMAVTSFEARLWEN